MQQSPPLTKPVGSMMRPLPRVWQSASVASAADEIRDSGLPAVGVTEGFFFVAVVTQSSLATALAEGANPNDSVSVAYDRNAVTLPPYASGEKALGIFSSGLVTAIPIVDDYGHLMGVLTPADLYPKRDRAPRPHTVGGMATPFGVYLTTGAIRAGAQGWKLASTGALMTLIFSVVTAVVTVGSVQFDGSAFARAHHLFVRDEVQAAIAGLLFLLSFRLLPLSGIHGAEHKVVHAIEKGEELTRENVRRMPRVHPRCGTNLVVGASMLAWIATTNLLHIDLYSKITLAAVVTFLFWKQVGSFVQYWGTTKEPTDAQLDTGIRAGEELLKAHATGPGGQRGFFWWLWNSGILLVMAGGFAMTGLLELVQHLFPRFNLFPGLF
jgi:CBS domain-containing protein